MANTYVRGITKETSNKIITVKILRLWISTDQQKKPVSIEAILMDSEGSKIPAYVKRGLVSNFKKQLIEGETVSLANFGVEDNNQSKWTKARVQCPVKLIFNYITKVIKCKPDMWIQSNGLELVPFDDIPSFNGEYFIGRLYIIILYDIDSGWLSADIQSTFSDIIGRIIRIGSIIYVDKTHARKLDIEIEDERNTSLKVVLWESYADKLLEIAPTNEKLENGLIMALQFAHKSIWQEELRVQTTMHATKMLINGDLPEFEDFNMKKKMSGNDSVSRSITLRSDIRTLQLEEWLNMDKHRTTSQPGSYILFVKFVDIGDTWYYNSCVHCKTKTGDKNAGEICPNTKCGLKMEAIVPRFRLKVIARDSKSNDDITVVLFEDMVANLIGKSAATVLASLIEDGGEEALPMDFQPILFQDYLIRIRVSREYNIVKGYNDYSVEHLTADEKIIGEYCSLAMNEEAIESKILVDGCKEKYVGKGKEKADDEYNYQGSNDISDTTLTPAKRKATEIDEEVSIIGVQQSSTKVVIKKEKNL
ncbi:hypothetical protein OROHE_013448 [Orobanche hederae]